MNCGTATGVLSLVLLAGAALRASDTVPWHLPGLVVVDRQATTTLTGPDSGVLISAA